MLTVWPEDDHAVVVAIGRHDESTLDVYSALVDALGLSVADVERQKPPCCDEEGLPPADDEVARTISEAIEHRSHARQRRA